MRTYRDDWNELIDALEIKEPPFFKEREVWWTSIGINIGHEEYGKGKRFLRPVLIFKKFGVFTFLGIPFSTARKIGDTYLSLEFNGKSNIALLGQIKTYDSRRLFKKCGFVDNVVFEAIRKAVKDLL